MTTSETQEGGTAQSRYEQLVADRQHFIDRAHECATLTIPTLFHKDATSAKTLKIKDPVQSLGARGVNTLASKMILSLLPMNTPFFKLNINVMQLKQQGQGDLQTEIEKGFGVIERGVVRDIEDSGDVTAVFEAVKQLIVTGNCLLYIGKNGTRMYDLNKYVVRRNADGHWAEIVLCEETSPTNLPEAAAKLVLNQNEADSSEKSVKLYTIVKHDGDRVSWHQEVHGHKVPGSDGDVPEKGSPWVPLRFMRVDGEDYGRGYVEMYKGDLDSLEVLSEAVRDAATSAAKVVWLVRPNGTTNARAIAKAPNNSVRSGDANDVTTLRMDKSADLRVAENMIRSIESRLAYAFMINAEVLRDAERVTAEEVRFVAQELDDSLGGIYSILSKEFQLPYVNRRLHLMRSRGEMPKLPETVSPAIVTGFAALGRGHDREKLMRYAKTVADIVGVEALPNFLNIAELLNRLAVSDGIETQGLVLSDDDRAAQQQQGQMQGLTQQLTPELIKQLGPMIQQQMQGATNGSPPAPQQQPDQG